MANESNTNALMYGNTNLTAIQFDAPVVNIESRYDFTQWTFNSSEQPSTDIVIEKNKITINKFKPNVPIIVSNFTGNGSDGTPKTSDIATQSASIRVKTEGFSANIDKFT